MSKLVLITEEQYRPGINEVGDIVGAFPDDWKFTAAELASFKIVDYPAEKAVVEMLVPQQKRLFKAKTTEWTDEIEEKRVWTDRDGSLKEVVKDPKYKLVYDEKDGIKETFSRYQENSTTITTVSAIEALKIG